MATVNHSPESPHHTPSPREAREAWVSQMEWAYEPKTAEDVSSGKSAGDLAGEAFDRMLQDYLQGVLGPLSRALENASN